MVFDECCFYPKFGSWSAEKGLGRDACMSQRLGKWKTEVTCTNAVPSVLLSRRAVGCTVPPIEPESHLIH